MSEPFLRPPCSVPSSFWGGSGDTLKDTELLRNILDFDGEELTRAGNREETVHKPNVTFVTK